VRASSHRTVASNWGNSSDWRKPPPDALLFERCGTSLFGYLTWSTAVLGPLFVAVTLVFLRG
jgi:hypothetical protein